MEVERKWLIGQPPEEAMKMTAEPIDQGYLTIGATGEEARLRRRGDRCFLTVKRGRGLVREEYEVELTPAQYEALWPATKGRRLQKLRRVLDAGGGLSIELDEYNGPLTGLFTAEVEFADERGAREFTAPDWFGREVTADPGYRNQELVFGGRPERA